MTVFTCDAVAVTLDRDPSRPFEEPQPLSQVSGYDSSGERYVLLRNHPTRTLRLLFPRITATEAADITAFLRTTVSGFRTRFTLLLTDGFLRTGRCSGFSITQTAPTWHRLELQFVEEYQGTSATAMLTDSGSPLLTDSNLILEM